MKTRKFPVVVAALPFAYREGVDEYEGIMRWLRESGAEWDLRIVRHSFGLDVFRDFPVDDVDGVICGMSGRPGIAGYELFAPRDALDELAARGVPTVCLDFPSDHHDAGHGARRAFISVDSAAIGRLAAQFLSGVSEYAAFGFVGSASENGWSRARGAAFANELRRAGHRDVRRFKGTRADLLKWLKDIPKPAAVFAANDHRAADVLRTCANGGVRVPDDLAVLGVDDDPIFCVHTRPTLSSIHPDFEAEGYAAAQAMSDLLARRATRRRISVQGEPTVTERVSTAPCSPAGRLVRRVDDLIAEHSKEILNSDMIADALGISRRLLDLRYRQINGISVREGIENARLRKARHLLKNSSLSHREIASACGFRSASYLEHVFIRRFGRSMSSLRT